MSWSNFITSAAGQIDEVVEFQVRSENAHFVVDFATLISQLVRRLDRLSSAVRTRWPDKGFSWSPWNDQPYNVARFDSPASGRVYTLAGRKVDYRQKRSFV